jgi:serine/threonine kinase 16
MNDDPADLEVHRSSPTPGGSGETELFPFAHRDMKPGNVMIADDGSPILMDFGSAIPARIKIETRSQALLQQVHHLHLPN